MLSWIQVPEHSGKGEENLLPNFTQNLTSKIDMTRPITFALACTLAIAATACGNRPEMATCRILEIEDAEFEVDVGDVDIEGGEVEMICDEDVVDVPWSEFRNRLNVDPGQYKTDLAAFDREINCLKDTRSGTKEVLCQAASAGNDFIGLKFNYDD